MCNHISNSYPNFISYRVILTVIVFKDENVTVFISVIWIVSIYMIGTVTISRVLKIPVWLAVVWYPYHTSTEEPYDTAGAVWLEIIIFFFLKQNEYSFFSKIFFFFTKKKLWFFFLAKKRNLPVWYPYDTRMISYHTLALEP